jgi:hypothetical protein
MTEEITEATNGALDQEPALLRLDEKAYRLESLSERAKMLSLDCVRTEQEWIALQHRYRQFIAMEATVVNQIKEEVAKSDMEPLWTSGESNNDEQPLLTIDDKAYDATKIPETVRLYVEDLMRNNQERSQLEFRLRQLDAARTTYLATIREELVSTGAEPYEPPTDQGN